MTRLIAIVLLLLGSGGLFLAVAAWRHADPLNPTAPYWVAALAAGCFFGGLGVACNRIRFPRKKMEVRPDSGGDEFILLPRQRRGERIGNAVALLLTVALPAVLLAAHLEMTVHPVPPAGHFFAGIAAALLVLFAVQIFRRVQSTRTHSDFRLTLSSAQIELDARFRLRAEITALQPLHVTEFRARILCFEHVLLHVGRYVHHVVRPKDEIILNLCGPTLLESDQPLSGAAQPLLDSLKYSPSGPVGVSMYPWYHWEIRVELAGSTPVSAIYPITVAPSPISRAPV